MVDPGTRPWEEESMRTMKMFLLGAGIAGLVAGAAALAAGGQTSPAVPDEVKALFKGHCVGCHKGVFAPRGMKLGADALPGSVLNVASKEKPDLKRIAPGSPETSYLLMKVRGAEGISGKRMPPPPKTPLTSDEIALLEKWVAGLE
jgi:mono/diheme cytochrome c family protein